MNPKKACYEKTAGTIIKNLKKRQMEGYYCDNSAEAVKLACSFLKEGDIVSFGGSMTLEETGLLPLLKEKKDIQLLDRAAASTLEERDAIQAKAFTSDAYFMSTNAITLEGELLNIDGNGNRVAALIWGPRQVIVVSGMNKVCSTLEDAYHRVKDVAAPTNTIRLNKDTPCTSTGKCENCYSPNSICSQTVITRRCQTPGRIKIILVGEELGY